MDTGSDRLVIWTGAGWIWIASVWVALTPALSATSTENPKRPLLDAVPLMVPAVLRVSPGGRAPEMRDHEYGGDPPDAASAWEYATPTVPAGSDAVVIPKAGGLMVIDKPAVAVADALSVTRTVKLLVPAAPGVPDMVPPAARLNPAGNVPLATVHEYGGDPPVAPSA